MDAVEELMRSTVKSDYPFVTETSRHLVEAGGKRFRPLLVLLAAQFGDPRAAGVVPAAVVVELTHLATLYHDDVMDEAALRRGAASANARWDNNVAILTGDFLFARASDILADLGPEAVRLQARTFERLVTGQIRETVGPSPNDDPVDHYLSVVADKTGSLIATSGRFGALLSGAGEPAVEVMTRFGERIGVAFQLSDDLLDVASDSTVSGQDTGHRPARGRADPAGPARTTGERPGRRPPAGAARRPTSRTTRCTRRRSGCCARTPRWTLPGPTCGAGPTTPASVLSPLPAGPARAALESLCDVVVSRTA